VLHAEHWRILDKQPEAKGQRLTLLIDRTGYRIFIGLSQGIVKVLRGPEAESQLEEKTVMDPVCKERVCSPPP
jgi:hypothetical protein